MPSDTPLWKILLLWLAFVINLALFFFLLPPEARKRILRQVISFALGMLALLMALRYRLIRLPEIAAAPTEAAGSGLSQLAVDAPLQSFRDRETRMTYSSPGCFGFIVAVHLPLENGAGRPATHPGRPRRHRALSLTILPGGQWRDVVIETPCAHERCGPYPTGIAARHHCPYLAGRLTMAVIQSVAV
jgi:hypothetical protein